MLSRQQPFEHPSRPTKASVVGEFPRSAASPVISYLLGEVRRAMATLNTGNMSLAAQRFRVPIDQCDVHGKKTLIRYRECWLKWMSWYEHTPNEPHSIESQIQRMIFNDLTYRASVSVRGSVSKETAISAFGNFFWPISAV